MTAAPDLPRRVKAARALGGFTSIKALVAAIDEPGLGVRTLSKIEAGEAEPRPWQLSAIASACGVPAAFWTVDLGSLEDETDAGLRQTLVRLEQKIDRLLSED